MMKIFYLTAFALTAFAFNSILCRMALATGEIDAASFCQGVKGIERGIHLCLTPRLTGPLANEGYRFLFESYP